MLLLRIFSFMSICCFYAFYTCMLQWMNALPASPRVASAFEYLWPISFNRIYIFINVLCGTFTIDISMLVTSSMSSTISVSCIVYPRGVNCCVYIFHILIWYQDFLHLFCHFCHIHFLDHCATVISGGVGQVVYDLLTYFCCDHLILQFYFLLLLSVFWAMISSLVFSTIPYLMFLLP